MRKPLQKGDKVVMHTCIEAEVHNGRIWTCSTDEFKNKGKEDVVFLGGFSGSFLVKYLQQVIVPEPTPSIMLEALERIAEPRDDHRCVRNCGCDKAIARKALEEAEAIPGDEWEHRWIVLREAIKAQHAMHTERVEKYGHPMDKISVCEMNFALGQMDYIERGGTYLVSDKEEQNA